MVELGESREIQGSPPSALEVAKGLVTSEYSRQDHYVAIT